MTFKNLYRVREGSKVATLIEEIEALAAQGHLTVSRWRMMSTTGPRTERITWGLHWEKYPRAGAHLEQLGMLRWVYLTHAEGNTEHCQAYRQLMVLKDYLMTYVAAGRGLQEGVWRKRADHAR